MMTRSAYGAATAFTKNKDGMRKALTVEPHLVLARPEDNEMPQEVFAGYSRFHFVLNGYGTPIIAKIQPKEMSYLIQKARSLDAANDSMLLQDSRADGGAGSPAYTQRISMGAYKGKTPAQVLAQEGQAGKEKLKEHYIFLRGNAEKYPRNRTEMDAISEAINLFNDRKLEYGAAESRQEQTPMVMISTGPRGSKKDRRTREDGYVPCFEMEAAYVFGKKPHVEVAMSNYFAPIKVFDDGSQNVQKSLMDKESLLAGKIFCPMVDWMWIMDRSKAAMDRFDILHAGEIEDNVARAYKHNTGSAS